MLRFCGRVFRAPVLCNTHHAEPSSAFEKWSGHVQPKRSRVECLEKIGFAVSRRDFIASLFESLWLAKNVSLVLQASAGNF